MKISTVSVFLSLVGVSSAFTISSTKMSSRSLVHRMSSEDTEEPVNIAKTSEDLMNFREAEVKHARLAMLVAAGWPMSELLDKKLALAFGMAPLVDGSDRVPSLLNGGLGKVSIGYWLG